MLDLWHYRQGLKERAAEIEKELLKPRAKLAIRAAIGAGRHSIAKQLAQVMDLVILELPAFDDMDAPLHGLVQLASQAGTLDTALAGTGSDFVRHVTVAAQSLADQGRAVVVVMPVPRAATAGEAESVTRQRLEQLLTAVISVPTLRVAVLATPGTRLRDRFTMTVELTAPQIAAPQIRASDLPGDFGAAARALAGWMASSGWVSTPLEARLQVGLIALGERPDDVGLKLEALARKLVHQLRRWRTVAAAVKRLLVVRRPIPISEIPAVSGVEPHWQPLLTECIGYGMDIVRVPEVTRQVLLDTLRASAAVDDDERAALEEAHSALATWHESRDGVRSLRDLPRDQAIHWLEKVHHLALGGAACATRWAEQEPAGREQLWERARYLSHELRHFHEAAQIYEDSIERFGEDPYSRHYLAYNLDRARGDREQIRRGYHFAAEADPENPWWQQRWIRFLIAHGTLVEARAAWQRAIRSIDPDGTRLRRSPWLALNFHFWIARRWLAVGRLEDARAVLSEVPERWLRQEAELRDLVEVLIAQEQSLVLGESVYPASTPIEARWREPRGLRPKRTGRPLRTWAPGRVVDARASDVTVIVAPTPYEAQQLTFDADSWRHLAGEAAEDAEGFFELGTYEGGEQVVRCLPDDGERARLALEEDELLARIGA